MVITGTKVFFNACPRELDVVGAQHLQHFRAHQAHDQRQLKDAQRHRGQDQVLPPIHRQQARGPATQVHHLASTKTRQPLQDHRKHQDQQDANEEGGQRNAQERKAHDQLRPHVSPLERGIHAHGDAHRQGNHRRQE
jgi:hypothetical protein